jgi:hypothetical protein
MEVQGEDPWKFLTFRDFIGIKACFPKFNFYNSCKIKVTQLWITRLVKKEHVIALHKTQRRKRIYTLTSQMLYRNAINPKNSIHKLRMKKSNK